MNRHLVVTGVAGGIGSAVAALFVQNGWRLTGLDREPEGEPQSGVERLRCDVGDANDVARVCQKLRSAGPVHALVNNAAVQVNQALVDTTDEQWAEVMNTNVRGAFICLRELVPALADARGAIVNVASVHAVATSQNIGAYAASKGALVALTRAAAVELAELGVRCNAVLPGAVDTAMLQDGLRRREHPDGPQGNYDILVQRTPLRAVAAPREIAESVLFLADTERSSYITGQALIIDGGATAKLSTE